VESGAEIAGEEGDGVSRCMCMTVAGLAAALLLGVLVWAQPGFAAGAGPRADGGQRLERGASPDWKARVSAPDRLLVRFKEGVSAKQALKVHGTVGAQVVRNYGIVPGLQLVRLPQGTGVARALAAYRGDPRVLYAEPDYLLRAAGGVFADRHPTVSDPYFGDQWNLWHPDRGIDLPEGWPFEPRNLREQVVAVLDTGVDLGHEDLTGRLWENRGETPDDGQDNDKSGVADDVYGAVFLTRDRRDRTGLVQDDHGHGTHVAGIIAAATNNQKGIAGVAGAAPVRILACKFMNENGEGWTSDAVSALDYVSGLKAAGVPVAVVNASWGGYAYSQSLRDAIARLREANILFVAAAGNLEDQGAASGGGPDSPPDSQDNDAWRFYPASYDLPNVVSVAASAYGGGLASWSNYGLRTVDLAAPGERILSTTLNSAYKYMSGTSVAAAHASGVAALLASLWPARTPQWWELRNALLAGAHRRSELQGYTVTDGLLSASGAVYAAVYQEPNLLAVLAPRPGVRTLLYAPLPLAALHVKGAQPAGRVHVKAELSSGSTADGPRSWPLNDEGNLPDEVPGDGLCRGMAAFEAPGEYLLTFRNQTTAAEGSSVSVLVDNAQPYMPLSVENKADPWWRTLGDEAYTLSLEDDHWAEISITFPVHCFGRAYDKLYVSDNGLISFGAEPPGGPGEAGCFLPDSLPTPRLPHPAVAALWQDFDPTKVGAVYYAVLGQGSQQELVVEWRGLYPFDPEGKQPQGTPYTFQVVLGEGRNDILVLYRTVGDGPGRGDVGGVVGVQFSPDAATPYPGPVARLALRFMVPGDLNQDARQDKADLEEWARLYGSSSVDPWDAADLCPDGQVDLLDFAVTGLFWHRVIAP